MLEDGATGARVRARIHGARLLHYVGHARAQGAGGWGGALELAGDGTLSVADVLALGDQAPSLVVLNGCSTGLADPRTLAGGMSLAHAFLVAGADAVIATSAEIDDAQAAAVIAALYERVAADASSLDGPALLRAAQLATRAEHPDWVRYRAWVR
ncbi:MAG: CHAT domain-containing protein [Myxococcales bacterium]|nr:CHAT domain-containing protein [Myxococcales bacterium]